MIVDNIQGVSKRHLHKQFHLFLFRFLSDFKRLYDWRQTLWWLFLRHVLTDVGHKQTDVNYEQFGDLNYFRHK